MKNKLIIVLLLAISFIGCQRDDEYIKPNTFSDVGWYFSDTEGDLTASVGKYIIFADASQGTLTHQWEIGGDNVYLEGPFERQDSIFTDKIIGTGISTEKTVSVLFQKGGLQPVRLFNTFPDSVAYRGPDNHLYASERVLDRWVIDTTFIVDVYDTIVPTIRIEKNGVVLNHLSTDTIFVEAGETLDVFDETAIGRPDTWKWNIGGATSEEQNASLVLKKLGKFNGTLSLSRTGQNIPGDWENYKIPAPFKVIPSSQPFVVAGDVYEIEDETIVVPYNGEFAPFIDQEPFFTVTVNGGANPVSIASISTDPADATLLWIKLNEPIYRPDTITVTYDGNGVLESTDTRIPAAFTDLPVTMHDVNLWDNTIANFEDGPAGAWVLDQGPGTVEYSTEQAATGTYSLKISSEAGAGFTRATGLASPTTQLEAGVEYRFTWKIYQDPSTTVGSYGPWLYWNDGASGQQFWQTANGGKPKGAWYEDTRVFTMPGGFSGEAYFTLRVNNQAIFYLDDIHVVKNEVRP